MPIIEAFKQSDILGRLILLVLFALSIFVWSVILRKYLAFREAKLRSEEFNRAYRKYSEDPLALVESNQYFDESPFYSICDATLDDLITLLKRKGIIEDPYKSNEVKVKLNVGNPQLSKDELDTIGKSIDSTISDEVLGLEKNLNLLATTAAASPLLGLLGTVWGILIAFQDMARQQSASIEVVTQGISTALVTTVVGLMVAIPSLVMYNYMVNIIRRFETEMENFSSEIIVDIERRYLKKD
jgi:biopolymer transport protein TolQ